MSRPVGLRTEIIFNMVFLVGASLLLSGFLFLKYHERELLLRRVESMVLSLELVAESIARIDDSDRLAEETSRLMGVLGYSLSEELSAESWVYTDSSLRPLKTSAASVFPDIDALSRAKRSREVVVKTSYPSFRWSGGAEGDSFCVVTIPIFRYGEVHELLQARFSLVEVRFSVARARLLILFYALLYGTTLAGFGIWLLNRTVVRPVRRLSAGTHQVADGDLEVFLPVEGPGEIAGMAESFNSMTRSLLKSREALDEHISSLKDANENLEKTRSDLVRSEKMAAVGHLAAGMAHEIGNPLAALIGYIDYMRGENLPDTGRDVIERSFNEAQRIDRLVKDLLDYATPNKGGPERVDGVSVLHETIDQLTTQGVFGELIVERSLPDSLPCVISVRHKLQQVFVNLLINARDASPLNGRIRLAASVDKEWVSFRVSDEGDGIDQQSLARIFDPFYTTKEPGKGRGLGLFVSHRIIEEMGGRVVVESNQGKGSTFEVRLRPWSSDDGN